MELLNKRQDEELKTRINDENYYNNFVNIAKQIAPDGKRVTHVGFTLQRNGGREKS